MNVKKSATNASPPPARRLQREDSEDSESVRRRSRSVARSDDRNEEEDEDPRPRKKKKKKSSSNAGLIIGLSVGGGLLVLGLVVLVVVLVVVRKTDKGDQQVAANPPPAAPLANNPPNANQPGNNPAGNNLAGNNPGGNQPAGNNAINPAPAAPPGKLPPGELYGDQGGEQVAPADAGQPNTIMRARRDDTFFKLSNPREGQVTERGRMINALLIDYAVVRRGKIDGGTLILHTDDGSQAKVELNSIVNRDHGTISLVGVQHFGPRFGPRMGKGRTTDIDLPKNIEMYVTRDDARYRPPGKFMVSNSVVMGQMKVMTRARDWTAEEIDRYGKPPPNWTTPNTHPNVGEDVPPLDGPAVFHRRFVEPEGRLLGLDYHLGEWNKEKCIGGLVPIFSTDQPTSLTSRVIARPGYAVAGAEVHTGKEVYAIRLLFRRIKPDGTLDAADAYEGEWIGTPPAGQAQTLVNDGRRVMGINLKQGAVVDRFALVVGK